MIHLHYSNRLEELIAPLAGELRAQQRADPLARPVVVVPNRIIEEFLKLRLAQSIGVAANIEFPFLRRYLARVVATADPAAQLIEADDLELVIFECLREGVEHQQHELRAAAQYASAGSGRLADRELRLFELSARTAHLLREYAISRADMLARWRTGPAPGLDSVRPTEGWQRHVFLSIFGADGRVLPRWSVGEKSLYFLFESAFAALGAPRLRAALAAPLHVFGLSYAGPEFIRLFAQIGQIIELHIYALNPCMEFWEDVDASYRGRRERLVHRGHKLRSALESTEDPFGLDAADDNLALGLWGKPGREYIRLLNELTDCDFDAHFKHPLEQANRQSLLGRIQEAILCREPQSSAVPPAKAAAGDESIRFLACPGIRREVEIVADSIWSLIRDEPKDAPQPLRFHQIALLIPDAELDAYLPHVETVFAQRYQIPLNMVDRTTGAEARVAEAVRLLLELPMGRFNRDAVLHLVTHPAIIGDAAVEQWEQWCSSVGVFFGADETELADTYIPANFFHWDQALRRMALGVFMGGEPTGQTRPVAGADGHEYLPCATTQDDLPSVAALIANVRRLLADALDLRERRLPMAVWADLLSDLVRTYVNPAEPAGRDVAAWCVGAIESMAPRELRGEPISYQVACARALERISVAQSEQGRYAEGGVAVGSFSALRSIPFRAIFALGMGETIFPQRDRTDLLDLRGARRRAGDVSASQRDRYLFLETLLAARERMSLSWVWRDALTGQKIEPSPLIADLKLIARGYLDEPELDKLTIIHPASSHDPKYFPDLSGEAGDSRLVNFDPNARRTARIAALRADLERQCGPPPRDKPVLEMLSDKARQQLTPALNIIEPPPGTAPAVAQGREIYLPLAALRRFLECPLQGAAQYALGMVEEDGGDEEDTENEPLTQTRLDSVVLLRDAFWAGRGDVQAAQRHFDEALRIHQLAGKAPVGPFAKAVQTAFGLRLELCVKQARALGITSLDGWQRIRIGGAPQEIAAADLVLDPIGLDVPIRRPGGDTVLRVWLRGVVAVSPQRDRSINCIARNNGGARAGDFLAAALGAIALAAAGAAQSERFEAIVLGGSKDGTEHDKLVRKLRIGSRDKALAYLRILAEDIFSGTNCYFLPIDAVEEIYENKPEKGWPPLLEITDLIESLRENEFGHCRSDYGPIPNPRSYPPPPPDEVIAIIDRRFQPISKIFRG